MLLAGVLVAGGLGLLAFAPDRFVAGSAALAARWGLSRVVIGAVVIGFGTSSPELVVSALAAGDGHPEVGVGNIVGSNMANLGLVVAVAALVGHLAVPVGILRRELPLTLAATAAFALAVQDGLTRVEGALLAAGLVPALAIIVRRSGAPSDVGTDETDELGVEVEEFLADDTHGAERPIVDTAVGLGGTLLGAQLLVTGAVDIATEFDLSGGFIGITIVALGTSLPELATAVSAARAGEDQLIIGNVLGSNLFNCLAVGAIVGLVDPSRLTDRALTVGAVTLMLAITALAAVAMTRRRSVTRGEAAALLLTYLVLMPTVGL